ncbi:hypothetical protein CLIB1444_01S03114 [[Candida] jaroonii]|uniref:Uncharacterized protein n=1 Tax=[Candida] jaroonii TaxID=467808 RepID=A0ACA9Y038_9ASCO|nr:hypothetical protein CLIB1444_01S03114 [[Candida] jaroonii]
MVTAIPTELHPSGNGHQLTELTDNLQSFISENTNSDSLIRRSNYTSNAFLDSFLGLIKTSGLANILIDSVLLSPTLLELTSDAVIFILKMDIINHADLFNAIQQSGIINQILLGSLDNPKSIQGVLRLTLSLLKKNLVGIYLQVNPPPPGMFGAITNNTKTRDLESEFMKISNRDATPINLATRDNVLYDQLAQSLKRSGLVASILQHLITDPELTEPSAQLLINVLQSGAVPICDWVHILEDTGILKKVVEDALSDQQILTKFGDIVIGRINNGLIPSTSIEFLLNYINQNSAQTGTPK